MLRKLAAALFALAALATIEGCVRYEAAAAPARSCPYRRPSRR